MINKAFVLLMLLGIASTVSASPRTATIAVGNDAAPYFFTNIKGEPQGLLIDLWRLWAKKTGVEIQFTATSFADSLKLVRQGKADIQGGCFITPGRKKYLDYVTPISQVPVSLFVRRNVYGINKLDDLRALKVGVAKGSSSLEFLRNNVPEAALRVYPNNVALFDAVARGDVLAFTKDLPIALAMLKKRGLLDEFRYDVRRPLYKRKVYAAVTKGDKRFSEIIKKGMEEITDQERAAIEQHWIKRTSIKLKDRLIIACSKGYAPFTILTPTGRQAGLFLDIWRLWASKNQKKIEFRFMDWEETLEAIKSGKADLHSGLFLSRNREAYMDFASPFYRIPSGFFVNPKRIKVSRPEDLAGHKVGAVKGSYQEELLRKRFPKTKVVPFADRDLMHRAASLGEIEAFIDEIPCANYTLGQMGSRGDFEQIGGVVTDNAVRPAVQKGDKELLALINTGFQAIKTDELAAIEKRWISAPELRYIDRPNKTLRLTEKEKAWLEKHKVVVLVGDSNYPPVDFATPQGKHQGISADYLRLLGERIGIRFEVVTSYPWSVMLEETKEKDFAGVTGIIKNKARTRYLNFSKPYFFSHMMIFTRRDYPKLQNIEGLFNKTVAVEKSFYVQSKLEGDYPQIKLLLVPNTLAALKAVADKKADAYIGNIVVANYLLETEEIKSIKVASPTHWPGGELRFAIRKDWPLLVDLMDRALESITSEEHQEINKRWLAHLEKAGTDNVLLTLSSKQLAWLATHRSLRLGVAPNWPPFDFFNDKKAYSGIASDYFRLLAEKLNLEKKLEPDLTWAQTMAKVQAGEIDVVPCLTKTPERVKILNFTKPYLTTPIVIATRTDAPFISNLTDLAGKTLAVGRGYASQEFLKANHPDIKLVPVDNLKEGLRRLSQGKVDAMADSLAVITFFSREAGLTNIKVAASTPYVYSLSMGVRKDWPELVGILDKGLESISRQQRNQIHNAWISMRFEHGVDWSYVWRLLALIVTISLFVLGVILFWNARLQREVRHRKRVEDALEKSAQILEQRVAERTAELQAAVGALQGEILERQQIERTLRKSEEQHRAVLEASPNCVIAYDHEGKAIYINPAFTRIFGWTAEELMGRYVDFVPPEDKAETKRKVREVLQGQMCLKYETRRKTKDDTLIDVSISAAAYKDDQGRPAGIMVSLQDITARKAAELEKEELEARLRQVQKMEAIGTLAGGIAHDFNNILGVMIGFADLSLLSAEENPKLKVNLQKVLDAGMRAKDLVKQILTFSRHTEQEFKPVKVGSVAEEITKMLEATIPSYIEMQLQVHKDCLVMADSTQLHQVLMNLCTNAVHAMSDKTGLLKLSLDVVEMDQESLRLVPDIEAGLYQKITISDTGRGISKENMERIFDPFFTTKPKGEGTGLGLSVAHGIIKNHGGQITAYSEPGKGTTFSIYLPAMDSQYLETSGKPSLEGIPTGNEHILYVDDEELLVDVGSQVLGTLGYRVTSCVSGQEALEAFRQQPGKYDLVITDLNMPKLTGIDLAREMSGQRPDLRIILCTGFSEEITESLAQSIGIKKVIMKPLIAQDIAVAIREVLDAP